MQFMIIGTDASDEKAMERRMEAREAHLAKVKDLKANNNVHMGAALLNESGIMVGSMMIVEFESRELLDAWLEEEPYVTGKVWKDIQVTPCQIAPSFVKD